MTNEVQLRDVLDSDLPIFFEQQQDPHANRMAAFTTKNPADKDAFTSKWHRILSDRKVLIKTITYRGEVAGHILQFEMFGQPEISYWLGRSFWGKGIASNALNQFLSFTRTRPLYARTAKDNIASIRVLEKGGFAIYGEDEGFANARGEATEEYIFKLE